MKKAVFPGSFDPFTIGHYSIVKRALDVFDGVIVGVGVNSEKKSFFSAEKRIEFIRQAFVEEPRVQVKTYAGLTVDFVKEENANFILRGLRNVTDMEYERTIADVNKRLAGIETIFLFTEPQYSCVSSTLIRDLLKNGKSIAQFLPQGVTML